MKGCKEISCNVNTLRFILLHPNGNDLFDSCPFSPRKILFYKWAQVKDEAGTETWRVRESNRARTKNERGWKRVRQRAQMGAIEGELEWKRGRRRAERVVHLPAPRFERKSIEQRVNHLCPFCSNSQLQKLNWISIENIPISLYCFYHCSCPFVVFRNQLNRNIESADSIWPSSCILRFRWIVWLNQKSTAAPNEQGGSDPKGSKTKTKSDNESFNISTWVVSLLFFILILCNICLWWKHNIQINKQTKCFSAFFFSSSKATNRMIFLLFVSYLYAFRATL